MARPLRWHPTTPWRVLWGVSLSGILLVCAVSTARAQTDPTSPQAPQAAPSPSAQTPDAKAANEEIVSRDSAATFKVRVNLVLVRVVARDVSGKVVTNLKKEDFQLTDDRKQQVISSFSVETPVSHVPTVMMDTVETTSEGTPVKAGELPERFITLFFDDLHLSTQDLMLSRQAATKLFAAMGPSDRLSIFTTSGEVNQDFTADRGKLDDALQRIVPRPHSQNSSMDCPPMTFYEADQIVNANDQMAMQVAVQDVLNCTGALQGALQNSSQAAAQAVATATTLAQSAAQRELSIEESQLQFTYQNLEALIRRMSALPGQRVIVMMSPGFFVTASMHWSGEIIDRATKANIVINTIDARGLYVPSIFDASNSATATVPASAGPLKQQFMLTEESLQQEVLAEFADGTGGVFFHNRNDIDQGLLQAAAEPGGFVCIGIYAAKLKARREVSPSKSDAGEQAKMGAAGASRVFRSARPIRSGGYRERGDPTGHLLPGGNERTTHRMPDAILQGRERRAPVGGYPPGDQGTKVPESRRPE